MEQGIYLSRRIGSFEVFTITSGTMIGAGIFVLPGILAAKAGPGAILCFVLAGIINGFAALSVCELATAMPMSGGSYFFISRSMGAMFGAIIGWGTLLGLVFKGGFAFVGAGEYFEVLLPVEPIVTALALCALLVAINLIGTRAAGVAQNLVVAMMGAIFFVYVLQGFFSMESSRLIPFFKGNPASFLEATGMCFIAFLGLIQVPAVTEEVRNPSRDIPLGILSSVVFVTSVYCLVMTVTVGLLPSRLLYQTLTPVADAAEILIGNAGLVFMVLCGLLATLSTGNGALLASSRYPFAMARDNLMPRRLAKVDDMMKTPVVSILAVGGVMLLLIVFVDLEVMVKLGSVFNIVVFVLVHASVIILRTAQPNWYNPTFRSPRFPLVQVAGIACSLFLIPFMGLTSCIAALALILLGLAWFFAFGRGKALPAYGLRDTLRASTERRLAQVALQSHDSYSHHSSRLLVPLWFTQVPRGLLIIAGYLSRHFDEPAQLVYCSELPEQTPVSAADLPEAAIECLDLDECLLSLEPEIKQHFALTNLYSCSRESGFVELAREYGSDLALMEFPPETTHLMFEVNRLIRDMPCDMVFVFTRPIPDIKSILVASGQPEEKLKLTIARALAVETGASVTFMTVYPRGARQMTGSNLEMRILKSGLLYGVPLNARVTFSEDVAGEVALESRNHDLLIVGSAAEKKWLKTPFGQVTEDIIEKAECPLLVAHPRVRREFTAFHRALRLFLGLP